MDAQFLKRGCALVCFVNFLFRPPALDCAGYTIQFLVHTGTLYASSYRFVIEDTGCTPSSGLGRIPHFGPWGSSPMIGNS